MLMRNGDSRHCMWYKFVVQGLREDGITSHVRIKKKASNLGVGAVRRSTAGLGRPLSPLGLFLFSLMGSFGRLLCLSDDGECTSVRPPADDDTTLLCPPADAHTGSQRRICAGLDVKRAEL